MCMVTNWLLVTFFLTLRLRRLVMLRSLGRLVSLVFFANFPNLIKFSVLRQQANG